MDHDLPKAVEMWGSNSLLHPIRAYISHQSSTSNKLELQYVNILNAKINYFLKAKKKNPKISSVKSLRV